MCPIKHMSHRSVALGDGWPASWGSIAARRRKARAAVAVLAIAVSVALGTTISASAGAVARTAFPDADVTFTGHGWGPGYGMGQWGAFGYAALLHWTYGRMLAHFYSNPSAPVTTKTLSTAVDDNDLLKVVIGEDDNHAVTVTSDSPFTFVTSSGRKIATIPAGEAARAFEPGRALSLPGTWNIETASSCTSSTWKVIAAGLTDPVAVPASLSATAPKSDLLTLCRDDGLDVTYRGRLEAYDWFGSATGDKHLERTLNLVYLEQYVADVTPGESPSGWGTYGGTSGAPQGQAWGFQELEAQAVAVRSYVLYSAGHGGWNGYASICDDICQYYARGIQFESTLTNLAASDTKGVYLEQSGRSAPTEYDSSSGGDTETLSYPDGSTIFDAVPDAGDLVCIGGLGTLGCNPWHTWTASIAVTTVERVFPSVGTLESVKVTATDSSRRVTAIQVVGESGTTSLSGEVFASDFGGFLSTLFAVTDGPGATERAGPQVDAKAVSSPGFRPPVGPLS
jgi:peptidoglycan hydrolase-like amidase